MRLITTKLKKVMFKGQITVSCLIIKKETQRKKKHRRHYRPAVSEFDNKIFDCRSCEM